MAPPGPTTELSLKLLRGGAELFPTLVGDFDAAEREILLETYIFDFTRSAVAVAEALERAAARGVTVRVVVDGVGTGPVPAEWQARWRAAGVKWHVFNPASGWRMLFAPKQWRRLHRKLCSVDRRIGFCGGVNLIDDLYDHNHGELSQPRFDFAVRVTGPLVDDIHDTMRRLWLRVQAARSAAHRSLEETIETARDAARAGVDNPHPQEPVAGPSAALVLRDNFRFRRRIEVTYRLALAQARSEVVIANAYFIPGVQLQRALLRAAKRGVRITLLLQGKYEYFMQYHASRAVYGMLMDAGIEIYEYEASFLHAKVAVMDGERGAVATVGSSNLDPLSLLLAREANLFIRDDAFAAELRGHLLQAMAGQGRRIEPTVHSSRPVWTRGLNWLAWGMVRFALMVTGRKY